MNWSLLFFANSVLLGVGLAMDAFSVSIVNAISEPNMWAKKRCLVAGVYAFFQFIMPMIGWICVRTIAQIFTVFQRFIPWIALILLLYIGVKMIVESIRSQSQECKNCKKKDCGGCSANKTKPLSLATLLLQGIATSIDALSVGFTIAEYGTAMAAAASLIIAAVTFAICMTGLLIGKAAAKNLSARAQIFGGCILILIGIEIFVRGVFF
ncbi:MAG: manganese efflux pump [Treponema sp.]|nr:manganese efflux pump [Treponema sp.]